MNKGLDFFIHSSTAMQTKPLKIYSSLTGLPGAGFYWTILEKMFFEEGYYLAVDDDFIMLYIAEYNRPEYPVSKEVINNLIEHALYANVFDKKMFKTYGILTSKDIQKSFIAACKRRKSITLDHRYLLIDVDNYVEKELGSVSFDVTIVNKQSKNVNNKDVNVDNHEDNEGIGNTDIEPYVASSEEKYSGGKIDYKSFVDSFNKLSDANTRLTPKKKKDIKRALNVYTGRELLGGLEVRARSNMIKEAHRRDWNTYYGRKKMEAIDKWVDRWYAFNETQNKMNTVSDYLKAGWLRQDKYKEVCKERGLDPEEHIWRESKVVEGKELFLPSFRT